MLLKDIHFDLCYNKNWKYIYDLINNEKYSLEEAIKTDYKNNCKYKRYKLRSETQCITEMVIRLLHNNGKFHFNDCGKIIIECKLNRDEKIGVISKCENIYSISTYFEYEKYIGLDNLQKKIYISSIAEKCMLKICEYISFPPNQILDVFNKIKENNFINQYICKEKARNKKYIAEILVLHEVEVAQIYVVFRDIKTNAIIEKKLVLSLEPNYWIIENSIGKLKWIGEDKVQLLDSNGKKILVCNCTAGQDHGETL